MSPPDPGGRHRDVTSVRFDGLRAVLEPVITNRLFDGRAGRGLFRGATLVDLDSGLLLDGFTDAAAEADLEFIGACQADLMNAATQLTGPGRSPTEILVSTDTTRHHILRLVPDTDDGGPVLLGVLAHGSPQYVAQLALRLRAVPASAFTTGLLNRCRVHPTGEVSVVTPVGVDLLDPPDPPTEPIEADSARWRVPPYMPALPPPWREPPWARSDSPSPPVSVAPANPAGPDETSS